MRYLIALIFSFSVYAESYEVSHRGHIYQFEETDKSLTHKSERLSFEIPVRPCSKSLVSQIKESFADSLKFTTASNENVVIVKSKKSVNVPEGHANGKYLAYFPDHFAKSYLVYKELCK